VIRTGPAVYLQKPYDEDKLIKTIKQVLTNT
jgi:YesN/AraC family two-component response regulator